MPVSVFTDSILNAKGRGRNKGKRKGEKWWDEGQGMRGASYNRLRRKEQKQKKVTFQRPKSERLSQKQTEENKVENR